MDLGVAAAAGSIRCSAASTSCKSSSKNSGRFIFGRIVRDFSCVVQGFSPALPSTTLHCNRERSSRFALAFRFERLRQQFAVRFFQQNLNLALSFFQLFLALSRQRHAFFKKFHRFVQRKLRAFQSAHHFLQPRQRALKISLFRRFRFFLSRFIHPALFHRRPSSSAHQTPN